jgi:hypothetical protein
MVHVIVILYGKLNVLDVIIYYLYMNRIYIKIIDTIFRYVY